MRTYDIIAKKRDGQPLSDEEIRYFIHGVTSGVIPDYEISALLMAAFIRGLDERETATLTDAMAHSGDVLDLSMFGSLSTDKHSTGGVGDKTSLIITPIVASLGCKCAKMSGRGLGHTGGTVDKLESIPGYRTSLTPEEFVSQVHNTGLALVGQSGNMAPADKKLYALRDVTATVNSIPLITSSIMSKKIAAGATNIVLDVKVGSGAFMKTPDEATALARAMVDIGNRCGRRTCAVITDMDAPLGCAVGNSLEVIEAVDVLCGRSGGSLRELCIVLAAEMVSLTLGLSVDESRCRVTEALDTGAAFAKMKDWIASQGGDTAYLDDTSLFPCAAFTYEVRADRDGYVTGTDAEMIGTASVILGAGRETKNDVIDHSAGIVIARSVGDKVRRGDVLCTLHTNRQASLEEAAKRYLDAVIIGDIPPTRKPLIYDVIR